MIIWYGISTWCGNLTVQLNPKSPLPGANCHECHGKEKPHPYVSNQLSVKPTKFCLILPTLAMVNMNYYPLLEDTRSIHVGWIVLKIRRGRFHVRWKSNCTGGKPMKYNTQIVLLFICDMRTVCHTEKQNAFIASLLHLQSKTETLVLTLCQKWVQFPVELQVTFIGALQ